MDKNGAWLLPNVTMRYCCWWWWSVWLWWRRARPPARVRDAWHTRGTRATGMFQGLCSALIPPCPLACEFCSGVCPLSCSLAGPGVSGVCVVVPVTLLPLSGSPTPRTLACVPPASRERGVVCYEHASAAWSSTQMPSPDSPGSPFSFSSGSPFEKPRSAFTNPAPTTAWAAVSIVPETEKSRSSEQQVPSPSAGAKGSQQQAAKTPPRPAQRAVEPPVPALETGGSAPAAGSDQDPGLPSDRSYRAPTAVHEAFVTGARVRTEFGDEGTIRFRGLTSFRDGEWLGIELERPKGKNDGSVQGVRYFDCGASAVHFCPDRGAALAQAVLTRTPRVLAARTRTRHVHTCRPPPRAPPSLGAPATLALNRIATHPRANGSAQSRSLRPRA